MPYNFIANIISTYFTSFLMGNKSDIINDLYLSVFSRAAIRQYLSHREHKNIGKPTKSVYKIGDIRWTI
jgi:hypothetical protein